MSRPRIPPMRLHPTSRWVAARRPSQAAASVADPRGVVAWEGHHAGRMKVLLLIPLVLALLVASPSAAAPATDPKPTGETTQAEAPETGKTPWSPPTFSERRADREAMVKVIQRYGVDAKAVLAAMRSVPRHEFVPEKHGGRAYADMPLPIGYGQTISQPYMVAEMTRLLDLDADDRVLEVGTGSGYQAAVLTHFTPHVRTIEIVGPLAKAAKKRFDRLGYDCVEVRYGDGYHGWPGQARFDAVIVTCAVGQIPPPLVKQLKPGGRMVVPVGGPFAVQRLLFLQKNAKGEVTSRSLMAVRFVPLLRRDPTSD